MCVSFGMRLGVGSNQTARERRRKSEEGWRVTLGAANHCELIIELWDTGQSPSQFNDPPGFYLG